MIIFYLVVITETVRSFKLEDELTKKVQSVGNKILKTSEQLIGKTVDEANEMIRNEHIFHEGEKICKIRVADGEAYLLVLGWLCGYNGGYIVEISNQKIVDLSHFFARWG